MKSKSKRSTLAAPTSSSSRPHSMNIPKPAPKDIDVAEGAVIVDRGIGASKLSLDAPAPQQQSLPSHPSNPYRVSPPPIASLADVKYGKAAVHAGKVTTTTFIAQFGSKRRDSATPSRSGDSGAALAKPRARESDDGPHISKRRRLGDDNNHEDMRQREEDAWHLNKAFRTAEDEISVKDAQIAALQQELVNARTGYERKESELRQDLLFRHILARERAAREHERERISLHRLVGFLKSDHERHVEKLEEEHRAALDNERTRTQEALAQAIKDKQQAQDQRTATYAHLQNMQSMIEHTTAISKVLESDLTDLQRLDNEEAAERDQANLGEPPAYDALQDIRGYRTPYAANRHQDNGAMRLDNMRVTVTNKFMRELSAATRTSLALREHEDRSKTSGAGSQLFHGAMLAFVTACQQLRALLDQAIEGRLELTSMCAVHDHDAPPSKLPSLLNTTSQSSASKSTSKLPSISDLGLPESTIKTVTAKDKNACSSVTDTTLSCEASSGDKLSPPNATSSGLSSIIATTECVTEVIYDLCTHVFAALDVREYGSERLCSNRCSRLGVWLRLVDDTLLKALTRRLEAEAVLYLREERQFDSFSRCMVCTKCNSEHCGGYCMRLHMISFNTTKLKSIRRNFDKISSPGRIGMYFNNTYQWLKEALENERQIAANAALPPTRQLTPVMSDEDMALSMQNSVLDETQSAARDAIRRDAPAEEVARRLQAVRDRHYPRPERTRPAATVIAPRQPQPVPATESGVVGAAARRQALHSILNNPTMMAIIAGSGISEADVRAIGGDTSMGGNAAALPPFGSPQQMLEALREQQREMEASRARDRAMERRIVAAMRDEESRTRAAHRAAAMNAGDTEDDDDGNVSDYVPPAQVGASSSGIRTRAQLRGSSSTISETPEL